MSLDKDKQQAKHQAPSAQQQEEDPAQKQHPLSHRLEKQILQLEKLLSKIRGKSTRTTSN